ncbi:hypothetical protein DFH08DRAFT_248034 [Mycena albidolilacea]|uniref:Transmembrane protein n=1 Tax=Mycena albidolilacea TaxID=1033008 RepID=A0AAD6ZUT3_9AGAR|nr:hypothetical protein DFH08DRAFT_248034 [Mycena albidolilacea]
MRAPCLQHVLFSVLAVVLTIYASVAEAQANRTVDDFSPLITYTPASNVTHTNTTGFDVTKLYNGTISIMNATTNTAVNMTLKFTGSAIWLFLAKPQTSDSDTFGAAYTIFLDGAEVDDEGSLDMETDAEYADVAFSNDKMHLGPHEVTLSTEGIVYFDYAVFTSNDPTPETTIPPVKPLPSSSSASSTSKAKSTSNPAASPSESGALKSKSHIPVIAGAAAVVVFLLGAGIAVFICMRRRRRVGGAPQVHYAPGGEHPGTYAPGGGYPGTMYGQGQQPVYGSVDPSKYASEAALLTPIPTMSQQTQSHSPYHSNYALPNGPVEYVAPPHSQSHSQSHSFNQAPSESQLRPEPADPFAYVQPHDLAMQRVMVEQRAVEAEYAPPTAWVVDEKNGRPRPQYSHSLPPDASQSESQFQLQHRPPPNSTANPNLPRVLEKHRAAEAEYAAGARPSATAWPVDEKRAPGLDVTVPSRTPSATGSWTGSGSGGGGAPSEPSYPPSPGSSSAHGHGEAALSTIAAQMAALRAQVARLEGERREEMPPAYD